MCPGAGTFDVPCPALERTPWNTDVLIIDPFGIKAWLEERSQA